VQAVTVEDSMSMVHASAGINEPASPHLKSEVAIIAGMAEATVGSAVVNWAALGDDNREIRALIARVLPAFGEYEAGINRPRGFRLRNGATHREWNNSAGKAAFSADPLPEATEWQQATTAETSRGAQTFVLQTFRSHDQYNTTIYGMDDRYRGIYGTREIVFMHAADIAAIGVANGDRMDVMGVHDDGVERVARGFRLVAYDIPRGCVAGYYPELNVLVPWTKHGEKSFTPTSKSVLVTFRPTADA